MNKTLASQLSQPVHEVAVDKTVMIPMRDGTRLAADIYRPAAAGKFPAIVERTPYNREESVILRTKTPQFFAARGYAFVVQDVRGRFGSEGLWNPFVDDGWGDNQDGVDTLAWVAAQEWSNGHVGTAGGSYAGQTQMLLAPTRPPELACALVRESASDLARQWAYRGGAFEWGFNLDWMMRHAAFDARRQIAILEKTAGLSPTRFDGLPLGTGPGLSDPFRWLRELLAHPDDGPFWLPFNFERQYQRIDIPIYHLAGWFDIFLDGSLRNYCGMRERGRSKATRNRQILIIGPWVHGPSIQDPTFARYVGDLDFGDQATVDFNQELLRWNDHWLKEIDTGLLREPRVRYFMMGANEWRAADEWPPANTQSQRWYLHAATSHVAGELPRGHLSLDKPAARSRAHKFTYDPAHPVPTVGGNTLYSGVKRTATGEENPDFSLTAGPRDQSSIEHLLLTYTSEPLAADLDIVGQVTATLFVSSNCRDTDFVARLTDVFPDGRSIQVVDGILRCRYRKSRAKSRLLKPGKIHKLLIDLWPTAWRIMAGHRLRLAVTSSSFPRFDRNLNTGEDPRVAARGVIATNRVHHDAEHPSALNLKILIPSE